MKSLKRISVYLLLISVLACSPKPDALVAPTIDTSITSADVTTTVTTNNVPADSYTPAEVTVQIKNTALILPGTTITFTCDKGTFTNGSTTYSQPAGNDGLTSAFLVDSRAEQSDVTVSIGNYYAKSIAVQFVVAPPDQITLQSDSAVYSSPFTARPALKATLIRINGKPSIGQILTFKDSTANGGLSVGSFLNIAPSDSTSTAYAQYVVQDTTFKGYIYLKGSIISGTKTISGSTRILIK